MTITKTHVLQVTKAVGVNIAVTALLLWWTIMSLVALLFILREVELSPSGLRNIMALFLVQMAAAIGVSFMGLLFWVRRV